MDAWREFHGSVDDRAIQGGGIAREWAAWGGGRGRLRWLGRIKPGRVCRAVGSTDFGAMAACDMV
jgi:hypothetical protein